MIEVAYLDEAHNVIRHSACDLPDEDCDCICECGDQLGDCACSELGNDYSGFPEGFTCTVCGSTEHYSLAHD